MSPTDAIDLGRQALQVTLLVSAPLLVASLVVGILVSLVQVATSLQDATLTFVPKIIAVGLLLLLIGNWMIGTLVDFTRQLLERIPELIG